MQIASGSEEYRDRMLIEICRLRNLKQEQRQIQILEIGGEALRRYLPHQVYINLVEVLSSQKDLILSLSEKLYICAQALTEKTTKPANETTKPTNQEPLMSTEEFLSKNSNVKEVLEKLGLMDKTGEVSYRNPKCPIHREIESKKVAKKIRSSKLGSVNKTGSIKKSKKKGKK